MTFNQVVIALLFWILSCYLIYAYLKSWRHSRESSIHIAFFLGLFSVISIALGYSVYATPLINEMSFLFLPYSIVSLAGAFSAYKFLEKASGKKLTHFTGSFLHFLIVIAVMVGTFVLGKITDSQIFSEQARNGPYLLIYELAFLSFAPPAIKFTRIFWQFSKKKNFDPLSRYRALGISICIFLALLSVAGTAFYLLNPYFSWLSPEWWWTIPGSITVILFTLTLVFLCWMPAPFGKFLLRMDDLLSLRNTLKGASSLLIYLNDARLNMVPQTNQLMLDYTEKLCKKLGLSEEETEITIEAAKLFGTTPPRRLAVQENILRHYRRGNPEKKNLDPATAFREEMKFYNRVCEVVKHRTERYNGKGYPAGYKGDKIPLNSQIVGVVDCFCNQYQSEEEAVVALRLKSGWQFDPKVIDAFLEVVEESKEMWGEPK